MTKFRSLYFIILKEEFASRDLFILAVDLEIFLQFLLLYNRVVPTLMVLDFGLQKPTGPSSGVVASILLVYPGLDCSGVNLAEVCATLRCHSFS